MIRSTHKSWALPGSPTPSPGVQKGEGAYVQQEAGGGSLEQFGLQGLGPSPGRQKYGGVGLHGRIASENPPGPTRFKGQTLRIRVHPSMAQAGISRL